MAENTIIHEISLAGYKATSTGGMLDLGTWGSYGIEKLHLTLDAAWQDLTITAFFNVNGKVVAKRVVGKDGYADVPWEATKENTFAGCLAFEGSINGQRRISTNLNYKVTNHSETTDSDPVPTDDRWNQFVTETKEYRDGAFEAAEKANARAEDAETASEDAQAAARAAKASENAAAASASNAAADAAKAGPYAKAAQAAQEAAENAAAAAAASKSAADTLAAEAARAALAAENSKAAANNAANLAGENATAAQQAAATATTAANDAGQNASDAAASKAAAETAAKAAETAAKAAENAQTAAAEAKAEAVKAQGTAQTAAKSAQDAQAAAENVRDDAKTAQEGAEAARDAAAKSAEAAAKSEANAKQSADTLAESVKNITPDDSAIGDKPWSSKHIIDMLCPPLEESGNPVVCYPVAGYALGVKAKWEPMQEGTGTPYPAGGGKNLFNPAWMPEKEVNRGVTWTTATDGTVTANGTADGTTYYNSSIFSLPAGTYTISAMSHFRVSILNNDTDNTITAQNVGQPCTFTVENDIQNAHLFFATSGTLDNVSAKPQIEKGSTATAYAPYENIRPIKGHDSVKVERCGENLLNFPQIKTWTQYDGPYTLKLKAGTYYLSCGNVVRGAANNPVIAFSDENLITWKNLNQGMKEKIQLEKDCQNFALYSNGYDFHGSAGVTATVEDLMLVASNEISATYTPYIGQTNTLTLPDTVYGGEVDAVSGEGKDTWKFVILNGTESWNTWGLNANNPAVTGFYTYDINDYDAINIKGICSHLAPSRADVWGGSNVGLGFATTGESRYLMFCVPTSSLPDISAGHEVASLKASLAAQYAAGTPVQICYRLAEPVPFTATGAQPIPALAGANTVLTDADSATVTGRADPIKRITDLEDAVASQT